MVLAAPAGLRHIPCKEVVESLGVVGTIGTESDPGEPLQAATNSATARGERVRSVFIEVLGDGMVDLEHVAVFWQCGDVTY
jgi:hypothetical protein